MAGKKLTLYLPQALYDRMLERDPETNWSELLREGIFARLASARDQDGEDQEANAAG